MHQCVAMFAYLHNKKTNFSAQFLVHWI